MGRVSYSTVTERQNVLWKSTELLKSDCECKNLERYVTSADLTIRDEILALTSAFYLMRMRLPIKVPARRHLFYRQIPTSRIHGTHPIWTPVVFMLS
jgi:hypothetical protein